MKRNLLWIVLVAIAMMAAGVGLAIPVAGFLKSYGPNPEAFSAAGSFFNLTYGLPLGIIGAILGAAATFLAGLFASRQGDVQILEFAEDKTKPAVALFRQMTHGMGDLIEVGNRARELGEVLVHRVRADGDLQNSPLLALLSQCGQHLADEESAGGFLASIDDREHRVLVAEAMVLLVDFNTRVLRICQLFEQIVDDLYASMFARRQMELIPPSRRPLAWLNSMLPNAMPRDPLAFGVAMPDLSLNLGYFVGITAGHEIPAATLRMPRDNYTVEFIGYVLRPVHITLRRLATHRGRTIGGYTFNLGAAYLLTIAQYIPDRAAFISIFEQVFSPGRSRAALDFLRVALPEKPDHVPSMILESLQPCLDDLHRLILVDVYDGELFTQEFYDPKLHGPIVQTGYAEFDDPPDRRSI